MRTDRGQILILTAVAMVMLLSVAGLSLDASYMYDTRNRLAAAADDAAFSDAVEVHRSSAPASVPIGTLNNFAQASLTTYGFTRSACGATIPSGSTETCVYHPPADGVYAGDVNYVEVILNRPSGTFFSRIVGWTSFTPGVRAVAGTSSSHHCIITLPPAPTSTLGMTIGAGNSYLNMPNCSIANSGSMNVGGGAMTGTNASAVDVGGSCTGSCGGVDNLAQGVVPPPTDPLASLAAPSNPGGCTAVSLPMNSTVTLSNPSGSRCLSSLTMGNSSTLYLDKGIYYVTGPITSGNSPTICLNPACTFDYNNGVLIFLASPNGSINLPNGTNMVLNAMNSGAYEGILFYQERGNTHSMTFNNGMSMYELSGAVYALNADVSFGNASGLTNDCTLFVARSLSIGNGTSNFTNTCSAFGGSPLMTVSLAE